MKESAPSFTINPFHYDQFFLSLYVKKYSLWEFKITKTLFIIPFSQWKAQFKVFCVCCRGRLVLFVSLCALHVGFLSVQCGGLARELHTLQVRPEELHGDQLCGLRPRGERTQTVLFNTHATDSFISLCFLPFKWIDPQLWFPSTPLQVTHCFTCDLPVGSVYLYCADCQIHATRCGHRWLCHLPPSVGCGWPHLPPAVLSP